MLLSTALALACLLLQPSTGPATAPAVELVWRAPAECPDAAAVTAMVSALLRWPTEPGEGRAVARAAVTHDAGRWQLGLDLRASGSRYRRILRADDCVVLARATALLIAFHLDPLAVTGGLDAFGPAPSGPANTPEDALPPSEPPLAPPSMVPAPPAPVVDLSEQTSTAAPGSAASDAYPVEQPSKPAARPAGLVGPRIDDMSEETGVFMPGPRPPAALTGHVRIEGGLEGGVLPGVGGHGGLFFGLSFPRIRFEAGLVGAPLRLARRSGFGGRFDRLAGAVRVCPTWRPLPVVALGLCVGGEIGAIRGVALRTTRPNPQWAPWAGLTLGLAVRWSVAGPLGLHFGVDGMLALARPTFTANPGDDRVFRADRGGARVTFGVDLQFSRRNR